MSGAPQWLDTADLGNAARIKIVSARVPASGDGLAAATFISVKGSPLTAREIEFARKADCGGGEFRQHCQVKVDGERCASGNELECDNILSIVENAVQRLDGIDGNSQFRVAAEVCGDAEGAVGGGVSGAGRQDQADGVIAGRLAPNGDAAIVSLDARDAVHQSDGHGDSPSADDGAEGGE